MADFNDIKDYAEERAAYSFLSRFLGTGDTMGKLFWTAFALVAGICFMIWGFHAFVNNGASESWNVVKQGDKLYLRNFFADTILKSIPPERLVRAINAPDID